MNSRDKEAIHGLIEPWNEACLQRDWDKLLSMCTEDIVFMPPDGPPVQGDAIAAWLDAFPTFKKIWWNIEYLDGGGDVACLRGSVKETLEIEGVEHHIDGKYTDVVRRGDDGKWRIASVMWNSNVPTAGT